MNITYNSWLESFKKPFGALELGEQLKINIKSTENVKDIYFILETDEEVIEEIQMSRISSDEFRIHEYKINKENIYFYYFKTTEIIDGNVETRYYGKRFNNGESTVYYNINDINKYQLTVSKKINTPKWFKEGVLYHIFVDRFNKTGKINNTKKNSFIYANWEDTPMYIKNSENEVVRWDFQGGNLKGIISKLNYLKNLGVSIIYLSPIFESQSNHKYDTGNYKKIDPMFGDEEIFKELIKEAENKG
ncbi:MAG: alpha-amylase family glycosyl hydrolase, partial [Paraclostridium sp.]